MLLRDYSIAVQPIIDFSNQEIFGYEAFIRGPKTPEELFRSSVHTAELDETIHSMALLRCESLIAHHQKLFLNCHPHSLDKISLSPEFDQKVVLEITEAGKVDYSQLKSRFSSWKQRGIQIALDDLGKGYNNVYILNEMTPDYIKVDKSFVAKIDQEQTKAFLFILAKWCKEKGIILIAEGIETKDQYEHCIRLGIPMGQGFYLGVPQYAG